MRTLLERVSTLLHGLRVRRVLSDWPALAPLVEHLESRVGTRDGRGLPNGDGSIWTPVTVRLPEPRPVWVWLVSGTREFCAVGFYHPDVGWQSVHAGDVTHWMEQPLGPTT